MWYFASGDAGFYFAEQLKALSWLPAVWRRELGFGQSHIDRLWFQYPYEVILKTLSSVGLSWWFIDKLLWISAFGLGLYSAYQLANFIVKSGKAALLASFVYVFNTYILLIFSGGQIGVALAYSFAPFVMYRMMKYSASKLKEQIINGFFLALLVSFDLRIAFLVVLATVFWSYRSVISFIVAGSLHLFWILPVVLASGGVSDLGEQFTNPGMLKFLSVADFSHAIALLHPNYPENLFGKVYFLQPEFLLLPMLAFSSLIFLKPKTDNRKPIMYFAFLALVGAFFAKGVNPPVGELFAWLFIHVPGFVMFRDPTKFYLYVAIGYSILIPYTLLRINKKIVYLLLIVFWIFTLRGLSIPIVQVPKEYVKLKDVLVADTTPSRTLWIPEKQSFSYFSDIHPILTATTGAEIDSSVKYVVVPIDVNKRIFLNDYTYDPSLREHFIQNLSVKPLGRDVRFHDLAVFENSNFSGMRSNVPAIVTKQQQLSNIGLGISVGALLVFLTWIFLH